MLPEATLDIYRRFIDSPETERPRPETLRAAAHDWARRLLQQTAVETGLGSLPPVQRAPFGKPHFGEPYPLYFNLSHSGMAAALAVSDAPVGIDIECRDGRRWEALSRRFFSETEQAFIAGHRLEERPQAFILLWTCKESLYKYIGCGLGQGLSRYTLQFGGEGTEDTDCLNGTHAPEGSLSPDGNAASVLIPCLKKIRASYEARTLYFHSQKEQYDGRIYRLTVCSPYAKAVFIPAD